MASCNDCRFAKKLKVMKDQKIHREYLGCCYNPPGNSDTPFFEVLPETWCGKWEPSFCGNHIAEKVFHSLLDEASKSILSWMKDKSVSESVRNEKIHLIFSIFNEKITKLHNAIISYAKEK